jgi:pSer/pThr/pTyr-binding forkhead associated (FHA) protein
MRLGAISGPHAGRVVDVSGDLTVGRDPDCALVLEDRKVSRRHATIMRAAGIVVVRDEGSLNGTWLNDGRVSSSPLAAGDRLRIGRSEFVVRDDSADAPDARTRAPRIEPIGTDDRLEASAWCVATVLVDPVRLQRLTPA